MLDLNGKESNERNGVSTLLIKCMCGAAMSSLYMDVVIMMEEAHHQIQASISQKKKKKNQASRWDSDILAFVFVL